MRSTVLVFNAELLPHSQTFVRDHVRNIRALDALLLGVNRVGGLDVDDLDTVVLPHSRIGRLVLWLFGRSQFLDRIVRDRRVVAVHAHFADGGMRIARYARRRRLPLIVTLHGADVLRKRSGALPSRLLWERLFRQMIRSATLFLAVSDHIKAAALRQGYPPDRLRVHHLGIPLAGDTSQRARHSETPNILYVGRMVEKKGLSYLLQACKRLSDQGCRFRLTVVGDGPLGPQHRSEAQAFGIPADFRGVLSPAEVARELAAADVFCMPSTEAQDGDNEGLPIVCLEAQAAGVPVVAFNQGPVPEGVIDGTTAILVPDKSVDDLAAALGKLLSDADLRARMGSAGQRFVREHFDIRDRSRELDELYRLASVGAL